MQTFYTERYHFILQFCIFHVESIRLNYFYLKTKFEISILANVDVLEEATVFASGNQKIRGKKYRLRDFNDMPIHLTLLYA